MKPRADEMALARAHTNVLEFEGLSEQQMSCIMDQRRSLHKWFKTHPKTHNVINVVVLLFLGIADFLILVVFPQTHLHAMPSNSIVSILLAAVMVGSLHSWLIYSLGIFSLHKAAAHKIVFLERGPVSRAGNFIARNLCRLAGGEPEFYAAHHMIHHAKFGTLDDDEFLNFVVPRRYWATFFPLAALLNFSDFIVHRPPRFTKGRLISAFVTGSFHGLYGYVMYQRLGLLFTITGTRTPATYRLLLGSSTPVHGTQLDAAR